ncbi:hypothetical protein GS432_21680 [Rhodococcus hoagii]|nr:hypothetical protein [Prescottella equi]
MLEVRELFGMVGLGERILHTAHEVKTARKAFKRLQHFFGSEKNDPDAKFPELNALVEEIRSTNGQEAIVLKNGGSIEFVARSKGSARGFTIDVVVMDEAQELADETLDALMPTTRAAPLKNRQLIFTGTPPGEKDNGESSHAAGRTRSTRSRRARAGTSGRAPTGSTTTTRRRGHRRTPRSASDSMPRRSRRTATRSATTDSRASASACGRRRPRGARSTRRPGVSAPSSTRRSSVRPPWPSTSPRTTASRRSVSPAPRRRPSARRDGREPRGHRLDRGLPRRDEPREPTALHRDRQRLTAKVLIEPLEAKKLPVRKTDAGYMGTACADIYRKVMSGELAHIDQPTLNTAVADVRKRNIGSEGLWGWNRKNTESDITPMVAVTLAQHAIDAPMPKPKHSVSTAVYGFN